MTITTQQSPATARIALREIRPNPASPRKSVDPAELRELAECVRAEGERQPILVRPLTRAERGSSRRRYEVVVGSGHFYAAAQVGLQEVECYVRGQAADDAVVAGLLDGARRCPLTTAEETELLRFLRDGRRMKLREIAPLVEKSIAYVSRRLAVAESPEIDTAVREGRIGPAVAQEILAAPAEWWPTLVAGSEGLSRDQLRDVIRQAEASGHGPAQLADALAWRKQTTVRRRAGANWASDPALGSAGALVAVSPSPAFALLRLVRDWWQAVPPGWRPTADEAEMVEEARRLIVAALEPKGTASADAG